MFRDKDFIIVAVLALVISFALFGNGISGDFVFDDTIVIVGNPFINENLDGFWKIFTNPYFAYQPRPGLYRPLTIASYSLNAFTFGPSPISFHIVNILLHALTSFLIFVFLHRLSGRIVALAGSAFFIFLPIHVEAVTSIVGRAEILSLLFMVTALLMIVEQKYLFASVAFFLGLLSKEMALAFIPIFLFLEAYGSSTSKTWKLNFQGILSKSYYFIPALVLYLILRYVALGKYFLQNDATTVYNPIKFAPILSGVWTSFKVSYLYFEKTFFPISLSSDYSLNQVSLVDNPLASFESVLGIVIFGLLTLLFFKIKSFLPRLGIIIFLASYFIISNWIFKTGTIMAERLMYTPSFGLALIFGSVIASFADKIKNKQVFYGFLFLPLIFYSFIIVERNKDWLNSKNLYESAYAATPNSIVNQTNKAYLEFTAGNYNEAEKGLNEVLSVAPEHVPALNLAGQNYKKLGQYQKAEDSWKKAIALRNDFLRAYLSLGILYYENGYFTSAEKVLTEAVDIYPRWSEVLYLALTKVSLDKPEEAVNIIEKHFGTNPPQKQLKFALGWAYLNRGDTNRAYGYFEGVKDPKVSMEDFVKTFRGSRVILLGVDN